MSSQATASVGALGGSANEQGGELRACVGALLASTVIAARPLAETGLALEGFVGTGLIAEADHPVDDLVVTSGTNGLVFVQVKERVGVDTRPGSPLAKSVAQFAAALKIGLAGDDWLVLACARPSHDLVALGALLDRRRTEHSGGPSGPERRALEKLETIALRHIAREEFPELLARMVIWKTDPRSGDGRAALIARLESHVCAPGQGAYAARELTGIVRDLARLRGGSDALGLAQTLADCGVDLRCGLTAKSPVAAARALAEHRARMTHLGRTLSLFGAPAALADLPLDAADAEVRVDVAEEERSHGHALELAQRRRGRCLLLGPPGGGKSTALRAVCAHAAERPTWPVPVLVHLKRVSRAGPVVGERIIAAACAEAPPPEREALRSGLESELARGNVLFALDGLDEVRRGRRALVGELIDWMRDLPAPAELVLATRPVAASEGRRLGLPELSLRTPEHTERTVEAILQAAAPAQESENWVSKRSAWVSAALAKNRLAATPLTVVTLSLLAAHAEEVTALPSDRADILLRLVQDVIETWELEQRHRGEAAIGPLQDSRAREAVAVTLRTLGGLVLASQPVSAAQAATAVHDALAAEFMLAPGDARSAADDAISFWTEAGLFALEDRELTALLRPVAELAHAWSGALAGEQAQERWLAQMRSTEETWPALALGAGLSAPLAREWLQAASKQTSVFELEALAAAARDGVAFAAEDLVALVDGDALRLLTDPQLAERTALALLSLPLDAPLRERLAEPLSAGVPAARRAIVRVLQLTRWHRTDAHTVSELREFIASQPPPPREKLLRPGNDGVLEMLIAARDDPYQRAFEAAAVCLAAGTRADAELVVSRFKDGSFEFRKALGDALRGAGHGDLAEALDAELHAAYAKFKAPWQDVDFDAHTRATLALIAELADDGPLEPLQRRRLDELADFTATASLNWVRPGWTEKRPAPARAWIGAVAALGGFDPRVLAAQARLVAEELADGDDTDSLIYDGGERRVLQGEWSGIADSDAMLRGLIGCIGVLPRQTQGAILAAITSAPDRAQAVALLETRIERVHIWAREFAGLLLLLLAPNPQEMTERWLAGEDPMLRSAAAEWLSARVAGGEDGEEQLLRCLRDADEGVRSQAISHLEDARLSPSLCEELLKLLASEVRPWMCSHCGAENSAGKRACGECHIVGPEVRKRAERLLGGATM
ncbi:MAG TPA: NACHT domain-containing protein [Solirubrobacteraceae bacterium]|nr:NACHT domain-containing protein [Solirubrobacteraceae bacterium]